MAKRIIPLVMDAGALSEAAAKAAAEAHDTDPGSPLPGPPPVRVWVAGQPIDEAEIAREMQHHREADPRQSRLAAARTLVVRALIRLECARLGISASPVDGETEDEALARQLLDAEIHTPCADAESVHRYYEANRQRLHTPTRLRVRHVLLAAAPVDVRARQRAQEHGEELIAALRNEPDRFAEFALRHSACPSRNEGGELGWITVGDTVAEFERQLFMLKPGLAGLTVETRYGHHVVDLLERLDGTPLSATEAHDRIAAYLETQTRQNAVHQYLQALADLHGVIGLEDSDTQCHSRATADRALEPLKQELSPAS